MQSFLARACNGLKDSLAKWLRTRAAACGTVLAAYFPAKKAAAGPPLPETTAALAVLASLQARPVTADDDAALRTLWTLLRPEAPSERYTAQWSDVRRS